MVTFIFNGHFVYLALINCIFDYMYILKFTVHIFVAIFRFHYIVIRVIFIYIIYYIPNSFLLIYKAFTYNINK